MMKYRVVEKMEVNGVLSYETEQFNFYDENNASLSGSGWWGDTFAGIGKTPEEAILRLKKMLEAKVSRIYSKPIKEFELD